MKKTVVLLLIVISILILLAPRLLIGSWESALGLGASLLGAFSGIGAIIFGYIVYKNLGVDRMVLDRQVNIVAELLEELKSLRIHAVVCRKGKITELYNLRLTKAAQRDWDEWAEQEGQEKPSELFVVFDPDNYLAGLERIKKLRSSPWMPSELTEYIEVLDPGGMWGPEPGTGYESHVQISFPQNELKRHPSLCLVNRHVTLREFYNSLHGLVMLTEGWLERNARTKLNLNI